MKNSEILTFELEGDFSPFINMEQTVEGDLNVRVQIVNDNPNLKLENDNIVEKKEISLLNLI